MIATNPKMKYYKYRSRPKWILGHGKRKIKMIALISSESLVTDSEFILIVILETFYKKKKKKE